MCIDVYPMYIHVYGQVVKIPDECSSLNLNMHTYSGLPVSHDTTSSSGFLPTYDVVGIPTMSYLPDVAYDVVGQDLRCRRCTTS